MTVRIFFIKWFVFLQSIRYTAHFVHLLRAFHLHWRRVVYMCGTCNQFSGIGSARQSNFFSRRSCFALVEHLWGPFRTFHFPLAIIHLLLYQLHLCQLFVLRHSRLVPRKCTYLLFLLPHNKSPRQMYILDLRKFYQFFFRSLQKLSTRRFWNLIVILR